ncbi:MAG: helix-turn-helix transcriptional regulator [Burkholderiales bacterium]|nr:helix-turn-helix transcriptional regulator [Burkholderiales bacterium]
MKTLKTLKAELLAKPAVRTAYDAQADEFTVARELIVARTRVGLTQADVAQRMGTTQSTVARLEGGKTAPSLRSLQRYAQAVGARAVVRIERPAARRSKTVEART